MSNIDWLVLSITLLVVIVYGIYKSRGQTNIDSYFLSNNSLPWYLVLFSIMSTQASAITFLSAPGQAYTDGLRFVQYYFGLPLAMIFIAAFFLPAYHKLKIYTAYEFLEKRFDSKTRHLTSFLFLLQRGLSTGISIYAPSLILSALMGWNIQITNLVMGGLLIIYTVSGGVRAISYTQTQQLMIIFTGMFLAGYMVVKLLPEGMGLSESLQIAGVSGRLNAITTGFESGDFNWNDKYNLFSGIIGGFFLALSYFGTDQSQVGRYLTARDLRESRNGLLMNGFVKVPMQFLILLIGSLVFTFYTVYESPLYFNEVLAQKTLQTENGPALLSLKAELQEITKEKKELAVRLSTGEISHDERRNFQELQEQTEVLRKKATGIIQASNPGAEANDTNYIFLHFVIHHLPEGLVGLLIAVIFLAAWGSIAAALNSLASTSLIDWHHPLRKKDRSEKRNLFLSRCYTLGWGLFSILIAQIAGQLGSLIEAVNVLGSLFYGTILGIFVVALFLKKIQSGPVFYAALLTEVMVILIYFSDLISFLWLNLIGCAGVMLFALIFHSLQGKMTRVSK
jgi:SSS family transporter